MKKDMEKLAARIDPRSCLSEVVAPEGLQRTLTQIVAAIRSVQEDERIAGRNVTALFHGPSGAGKTMAALAIARELDRQVLRIDLSSVISKYIGETEKHLDAVFEDAKQSGAVLLLDEADALFGKRTEVRDSHDRYANIEVAYLLQRIENHEGVAILTANTRQNIDEAFMRRLRFVIEFPPQS